MYLAVTPNDMIFFPYALYQNKKKTQAQNLNTFHYLFNNEK